MSCKMAAAVMLHADSHSGTATGNSSLRIAAEIESLH